MAPAEFEVSVPIQVRFRDTDAMGHVNNAVFLSYLEMARVAYCHELWGDSLRDDSFNFILARVEIDFLAPVGLFDDPVVHISLSGAGRSSFEFTYLIESSKTGKALARAKSIQVAYDYTEGKSVPLPEADWNGMVELKRRKGLPPPERRTSPHRSEE